VTVQAQAPSFAALDHAAYLLFFRLSKKATLQFTLLNDTYLARTSHASIFKGLTYAQGGAGTAVIDPMLIQILRYLRGEPTNQQVT
jgi:hypothetical protein